MSGRTFLISFVVWSCGSVIGSAAQLPSLSGSGAQSVLTMPFQNNSGNRSFTSTLQIPFGQNPIDFKAPTEKPETNDQPTVSAAQLKVPNKARHALQKAMDALAKGNTVDAAHGMDEALALYPRFSEALAARALSEQHSDPTHALEDAEKAIEYDPHYSAGYVTLASIYTTLHKPDDAIRTLDHASGAGQTYWPTYYEMGRAMASKGDYLGALSQIEKARSFAPKRYPYFHFVRAVIFIGLGNDSAAIEELRAYLREDPKNKMATEAQLLLDQLQTASTRH
jgi:tetratricopeptide (TPR) repeat protein